MREEQTVFGIVPDLDGAPMIMVGIPTKAWEYMRDGKTHTFDLTKAGLPLKLMLYGGKDHAECVRIIEDAAKQGNIILDDQRRKDFSIEPKK